VDYRRLAKEPIALTVDDNTKHGATNGTTRPLKNGVNSLRRPRFFRSARPIHHRCNIEASLQHFCGRSLSGSGFAAGENRPVGAYFGVLPPISS
jgi:hypothetical protein